MKYEEFLSTEFDNDIINLPKNTKKRKEYLRSIFCDKELMEDVFINQKFSVYSFNNTVVKSKLGIVYSNFYVICKELGVPLPSYREGALIGETKRKEFYKEKYGVTNCLSKGTPYYKKRNETVKEKYGVDNVFQLKTTKDKIRNHNIKTHGVPYVPSLTKKTKLSGIHTTVSNYLDEIGVVHDNEVYLKELCFYNDDMGRHYWPIVDIFIKNENLVLEIYGDFWHCNPDKYKANDLVGGGKRFNKNHMTASDVWESDKIRQKHIETKYKFASIWESDIKNGKFKGIVNDLLRQNCFD